MVELVSDRTYFIDRCISSVAGLSRLVILGSGLDMRAYRLNTLRDDCHIYEVRDSGIIACHAWYKVLMLLL